MKEKGEQKQLNKKVLLNILLGGGRFHLLPQFYKIFHGLCLNNFLQVWLLGNQRYPVTPFRYINRADKVSHFFRGRKVLGDMKYSMRSV